MAKCVFCNNDNDATETVECNVSNCPSITVYCCPSCLGKFSCTVCEFTYCKDHMFDCASCGNATCAYDARKLPGDPNILDLNCFDKATSHMIEEEIIASCPFASVDNLPEPDDRIFDVFDPPIELITYSQSKTASKKGTRPDNVQAEHFVPNSCFIVGTGRTGNVVSGAGLYSEGKALTYWVDDDQMPNTEHKFLTDKERAFCEECESKGQFPTLGQWLDFMQTATAESIYNHRNYTGPTTGMTPDQINNVKLLAANQAAYAVRYRMEQHFVNVLHADLTAYMGNGLVQGVAPPKKVSKGQRYKM